MISEKQCESGSFIECEIYKKIIDALIELPSAPNVSPKELKKVLERVECMNKEQLIYNKLMSKEKLSESEIRWMVFELNQIHEEKGDCGRWTQYRFTVVELLDKKFAIEWERGLTECQENEFWYQPYEVEKHEYEKTITVTEWRKACQDST